MSTHSTYETPDIQVLIIESEQMLAATSDPTPTPGTPGGKITEGSSVSIW